MFKFMLRVRSSFNEQVDDWKNNFEMWNHKRRLYELGKELVKLETPEYNLVKKRGTLSEEERGKLERLKYNTRIRVNILKEINYRSKRMTTLRFKIDARKKRTTSCSQESEVRQ